MTITLAFGLGFVCGLLLGAWSMIFLAFRGKSIEERELEEAREVLGRDPKTGEIAWKLIPDAMAEGPHGWDKARVDRHPMAEGPPMSRTSK